MSKVETAIAPQEKKDNFPATFKDSVVLTRRLKLFLYLCCLANVITIGIHVFENYFLLPLQFESVRYLSILQFYEKVEMLNRSFFHPIVLYITIVLALIWIYRANQNARVLGANNMQFTPGWAVGWFFIPIFSLWKPYQALREIWKVSAKASQWKKGENHRLVGYWWFFWTLTTFEQFIFCYVIYRALPLHESFFWINTVYSLLCIVVDILAIAWINAISTMQIQWHGSQDSV